MKKFSVALLVCSALLLSACSNDKTTDSTSKQQETKSSQTKESSSTTTTSSISSATTDSSSTAVTSSTTNSVTTPATAQEETYEQLKQRTLQSIPTDRVNWSNKEWEAFGMALNENSLAMDDNGYIITQAQKEQLEAERQTAEQSNGNNNAHGAPRVVNSEAQAVQIAQSQFGDNNGAWTWGCMYEDERGYFVKATDPNDGTMTHTAKSVFVHYDGSVTEN